MKITTRVEEALENKSNYCYENGVLANKLNIKDQKELDEIEASLSYLRLCKLEGEKQDFKFDANYYLELHKYIFQDIYYFAGEIRGENITKTSSFCRPEFVFQFLSYNLDEMRKDVRNIKTLDDYIGYLSKFYGEINMVHPFREGNGRTQREYFRQLVEFLNDYLPLPPMYLDYSSITEDDKNNLINGCRAAAISDDLTLLKKFFKTMLKEKDINYCNEKTV